MIRLMTAALVVLLVACGGSGGGGGAAPAANPTLMALFPVQDLSVGTDYTYTVTKTTTTTGTAPAALKARRSDWPSPSCAS